MLLYFLVTKEKIMMIKLDRNDLHGTGGTGVDTPAFILAPKHSRSVRRMAEEFHERLSLLSLLQTAVTLIAPWWRHGNKYNVSRSCFI